MTTTVTKLVFGATLFLTAFYNIAFFRNVIAVYPITAKNAAFLITLAILLAASILLFLTLTCFRRTAKPVLIAVFLTSAVVSYFMIQYNVFVDDIMFQNIFQTNVHETLDLVGFELLAYVVVLGLAPAVLVYRMNIESGTFKAEMAAKLMIAAGILAASAVIIFSLSKFYASFFREQKSLQYYANPTYYIFSGYKFARNRLAKPKKEVLTIGEDARVSANDRDRELIIMVVGETARADRFSLNGYHRETNPLLKKEDFINFPNMYSCGTSTAVSVPCMFSIFDREQYSHKKSESTQNILDVLKTAGVTILWRDNNSSSHGVADRVAYEDYKLSKNNPVCDIECRDEGMLAGLETYIDSRPAGDIVIVLHQMGSHGPAYYKRYPKSFEKFAPVCMTTQLEDCTAEEINNAYDNTILYTDYFLSKVIALLKRYSPQFETAMIYMSDHGESLGEGGLYLHGAPYFMAPEAQRRVPAFIWLGDHFRKDVDMNELKLKAQKEFTQDMLFHTLLGMLEIRSAIYNPNGDFMKGREL